MVRDGVAARSGLGKRARRQVVEHGELPQAIGWPHQITSIFLLDHGHKVDAIFYSPDGAAIELTDTASIETQVLDGGKIIHSDQAQMQYFVVMTSTEDRWKLRVLESSPEK